MTFLENLKWRYAVQAFDTEKKVSDEDFDKILEAIHYVPTSAGLQPFHVIIVEDPATRTKIREVGFDQPKITESSHLLVFCARTDLEKRVGDYMEVASGGDKETREKMAGLENMLSGTVSNFKGDKEKMQEWAQRQTYIALGFALAACAEMKIDSGPMEGFMPLKVDEILGLPAHMKSVAMMSVGYRSEEPRHPKVRFEQEELIEKKN